MAQNPSTVDRIKIFKTNSNGLSARDAIMKTAKAGKVMASTLRMCKALVETDEWKSIKAVFPCWTGTLPAYVEPGAAFNKSKMYSKDEKAIAYIDPETKERWIFPVGNYGSEKNAVLVSEHPDYSLEIDGKEIMVKPKVVDIILHFPEKDGWYLTDPKHGIPFGDEVGSANPEARYLVRVDDSGRVGPVARGYDDLYCRFNYNDWRNVFFNNWPSAYLGVAIEAPE